MEEKILEILDALQTAIMTIAPQAWELLVRKQFVSGIIELVLFIIVGILLVGLVTKTIKFFRENADDIDEDISIIITAVEVTMVLVYIIVFLGSIETILLKIFMPEYMAVMQLIDWVK